MNKKGASHVEVVFAFVLFITFVAGAIYFINPTKSDQSGEIASRYALDSIINNASSQLSRYSFVAQGYPSGGVWFNMAGSQTEFNAIAKTESGELLPSKQQSNQICVLMKSANFTSVELSEAFDPVSSYSGACESNQYSTASIISEKVLSEKKINLLKERYYSDYLGIKSLLGVPIANDFSFYLIYDGVAAVEAHSNSTGISKYSYERNVKIARANGEIKFGVLRVVLW